MLMHHACRTVHLCDVMARTRCIMRCISKQVVWSVCAGPKLSVMCSTSSTIDQNILRLQGSLVRAVRRIEEVLRQLSSAAQVIGEGDLEDLFEKSREKIKRDIIFAASLYL